MTDLPELPDISDDPIPDESGVTPEPNDEPEDDPTAEFEIPTTED